MFGDSNHRTSGATSPQQPHIELQPAPLSRPSSRWSLAAFFFVFQQFISVKIFPCFCDKLKNEWKSTLCCFLIYKPTFWDFSYFCSEGHIGLERKVTKLEAMVKMLQEDLKKVKQHKTIPYYRVLLILLALIVFHISL